MDRELLVRFDRFRARDALPPVLDVVPRGGVDGLLRADARAGY